MKRITLLFALSLAAAAQTANISGVTLTGPSADPTIENHTNKGVVAALISYPLIKSHLYTGDQILEQMFVQEGELTAGSSQKVNGLSRREVARVDSSRPTRLLAAIFSDGEFQGEESANASEFRMGMEQRFQSIKRAYNSAKSGDWDELQAQSKDKSVQGFWGAVAARKLLDIHNAGGDINKLAHYGTLPAFTWKSSSTQGSLWDKIGHIASSFVSMFGITAYAQSNAYSGTSIAPYPQGTGTDANHPTEWGYVCGTYPGSNYPCPGREHEAQPCYC